MLFQVLVAAAMLDCKSDYGCFEQALSRQQSATMEVTETVPIFGLQVTQLSLMRIDEFQDGGVRFYEKVLKSKVVLTPQARAQMRKQGISDSDIRSMEQQATASAATTIGTDGTCTFKVAALDTLLREWQGGSFSSDDWKHAEHCSGKLFRS
jgi:hypothetical protein